MDPGAVRSYDEVAQELRALRSQAGMSYRELHRRVVAWRKSQGISELPARDTVHRCLQPGRTRLDADLVADIARALTDSEEHATQWRHICLRIAGELSEASVVEVATTLPFAVKGFVGRERIVASILDGKSAAYAIVGMPGVGKTSLAIRVAQQVHTDGRRLLFVNLRGFEPDQAPADPSAVLDGLLRELGVPGDRISCLELRRRVALYRDLAQRVKPIVVLDNAADEQQVRPLLPAAADCLTLVTSRRPITLPGIEQISLDVLTRAEAVQLLARDDQDELAGKIVDSVGRLPLAVALMSARIKATPDWTLADHLARLEEHRATQRLEPEVERAIASSYRSLAPEGQRMFRLLALHPGRQIEVYAAAALAGSGVPEANQHLTALADAALLTARSATYLEFHDLVLDYASRQLRDDEPASRQMAARDRLFAHYWHTVKTATDRYLPREHDNWPDPPGPSPTEIEFADRDGALTWLTAERANLLAFMHHTADRGEVRPIRDLAMMLGTFASESAHFRETEAIYQRALDLIYDSDRAYFLMGLSGVYEHTGRGAEAIRCSEQAWQIYRETGDARRTAYARGSLGNALFYQGRVAEAMQCWHEVKQTLHRTGNPRGEASALRNLATANLMVGRAEKAMELARQAFAIAQQVGDTGCEANAFASMGRAHLLRGEAAEALDAIQTALTIARASGLGTAECDALNYLGRVFAGAGRFDEAVDHQGQALRLAREIGDRQCEAEALNDLAVTHRLQQQHAESGTWAQQALAVADDYGFSYERARAHDSIAHACASDGSVEEAHAHWRKALAIHAEIGTPEAAEIRARVGS